jgi:hypothetical protein
LANKQFVCRYPKSRIAHRVTKRHNPPIGRNASSDKGKIRITDQIFDLQIKSGRG